MFRVEASTTVDRSLDEVWAFIAHLDRLKDYDPGAVEVNWPVALLAQRERAAEISNAKRILEAGSGGSRASRA